MEATLSSAQRQLENEQSLMWSTVFLPLPSSSLADLQFTVEMLSVEYLLM